jgi:uncharacterized protein YbaR (Trm112 family)
VATVPIDLLRCPFCRSTLAEAGAGLRCTGCSRSFGITDDGIPLMLHPDLPGAKEKLAEAEGWLVKAHE